jgi:hypothetical protein
MLVDQQSDLPMEYGGSVGKKSSSAECDQVYEATARPAIIDRNCILL